MEDRGTLKPGEYHQSADSAMEYYKAMPLSEIYLWLEAFSSCAIEGNRFAEVCSETLNRLLKGEPVSDRYLLGVMWAIASPKYKEKSNDKKDSDRD